jgi:hypothetical protein
LDEYTGEYELLSKDYQVWLQKKWQKDPHL